MSAAARRPIRSYVLREGRLTAGQRRALDELWPKYGLALPVAGDAPPPDYAQAFGRDAPLHLEIGFGDGGALLEMAANNPHCNYLGAEVHRPGVGRALLEIEAHGLANIRLFCADGIRVLSAAVAARQLAAVYLYFPDPWPKKRHHKRRIVQPDFIQLAFSRLAAGGHFHFATDWRDYAEDALARLEEFGRFENCAGAGQFAPRPPGRPLTKFERRGRRLGHQVWDIVLRKGDAE